MEEVGKTENVENLEDLEIIRRIMGKAREFASNGALEKAESTYVQCIQFYKEIILQSINNLVDANIFNFASNSQESAYNAIKNAHHRILAQHPLLLDLMKELAFVYQDLDNFDQALLILTERYEILRAAHGDSSENSLLALKDIGVCNHEAGDFSVAESIYQKCLEGYKDTFGLKSAEAMELLQHLGGLFFDEERFDAAESIFNTCYYTRKETLGEDNLDTVDAAFNLAEAYEVQRKLKDCSHLLDEIIPTVRSISGQENRLLKFLSLQVQVKYAEDKYEEAEMIGRDAISISIQEKGEEHRDTLRLRRDMAVCVDAQGRYEEASKEYEGIYQKFKSLFGENDEETRKTKSYLEGLEESLVTSEEAIDASSKH